MISAPDAGNMVIGQIPCSVLRPQGDWIPFQGSNSAIFSFALTTGDHFLKEFAFFGGHFSC